MKPWKRVLITGSLLTTVFTAGVYAEEVLQRVDAYLRPDFNVVLDGKQIQLESPPLVYAGKTYLSLKEVGNLLGASIIWKDATKSIFINSRINPEQEIVNKDQTFEEFKFRDPYAIMVNYLGSTYPLMLAYADDGGTTRNNLIYYRLSDVRRMGIDTNGLKQSKEMLTGALYISEPEMKKRLKQLPSPISKNERYLIAGEVNTNKIKALKKYLEDNGSTRTGDIQFTNTPIMIEKLETENMYEYLYYQTRSSSKFTINHYISTKLILTQMEKKLEDGSEGYTINNYGWTDLNDQLEREITRKADEAKKAKEEAAIKQGQK